MKIIRYADPSIRYGLLEDDGSIRPFAASPFESLATRGAATRIDKVKLLAPVEPRNVYGVGLNYVRHAKEMDMALPAVPMLFMKHTGSVSGPEADIPYPAEGQNVHFEGEIVAVIGRTARRVPESTALDYVLGYTLGNDVSERVIQGKEMKQGCLLIGKAFDGFAPLGPAIATGLEPADIPIIARVNGKEKQNSNTNDLVFSIARLVSYMSSAMTLLPGDVIMTGTPSGVGPIRPGDTVEIESPRIGILRNKVVNES
jgi:2-keto-4-pentenoate hydratase/2-oxohepta-3-ene-1,7-dioic acid hydratase in catechol pathway